MKCAVCGKEFGNGANCKNCGTDRVTGLGNYSGYVAPVSCQTDKFSPVSLKGMDNPSVEKPSQVLNVGSTVCYACGEIIPADSNFCPYCSRELYVTCPKCGNKYSSQFPACSRCGTNRKKYMDLERIRKMNPFEIPYGKVSIEPNEYYLKTYNFEYVIIPDTVTTIGDHAFYGCKKLKEIIIPNSVTRIDNGAFSGCELIKEIVIPDSVRSIGEGAFLGCKSLQRIHLPNIIEIKDRTFMGCVSLSKIDIPATVQTIGEESFCLCESLKEINIPCSVTYIGENAFGFCKALENVVMPSSLNSYGNWPFQGCYNLNTSTKTLFKSLEKKFTRSLTF